MNEPSRREERFEAMAGLVRTSAQDMPEREYVAGLDRFNERWSRPSKKKQWGYRPLLFAGALAAALLVFVVARMRPPPELTYTLGRTEIKAGGYFTAGSPEGAKLQFSDGTELEFDQGARGRLLGVDATGARIAVEEGRAHVRVRHRESSRWVFHAGPFMVAVTGTVFDMRWQASEEILEVEMHDGAVVVSGPLIPDELKLRAQERLTLNARAQTINIRRVAAEPEPAAAPLPGADGAESPARQAPPNGLELARAAPSGSAAKPSVLGLAELLAAGQPAAVLARAETRGIDWCLANASSDDLAALADAARYGRRSALAERALLSTRQRFPGTRRAREATFFLGTNAEASSPSDAVRWYEQYLKEDGAGTYAREALGRELALLRQLGGNEKARPAAEDYLRKYPTGPYASVARSVIDGQ